MRPVTLSIASFVASANDASLSQSLGAGGGALILNGTKWVAGTVVYPTPTQVIITSAGNDSGINWTVTGTGVLTSGFIGALTDVIKGGNVAGVMTPHKFLTVTSIVGSGATASTVTAGSAATLTSAPCPVDFRPTPTSIGLFFEDTGSTTQFSVQYSGDDPWSYADPDLFNVNGVWLNFTAMVGMQANAGGNISFPVRAVRLLSAQNGADTGTLNVVQAGL